MQKKPSDIKRTCNQCRKPFFQLIGEKNIRCPECRDARRYKNCQTCGAVYRDSTDKNTRRFCDSCQQTKIPVRAKVSERTEEARKSRVKNHQGGRADDIQTMTPYTHSWWGRVGELLFLHLYPDASDSVSEYGNRVLFDAQHRIMGRVNVKTAKARISPQGKPKWDFALSGKQWDTGFLIGFSKEQDHVVQAWCVPAGELPGQLKVMSPASCEYKSGYELAFAEIQLLDRKFQTLLQQSKDPVVVEVSKPVVEYERILLGKVGEAIYHYIYPLADHEAKRNPLATFDFTDPDGRTVNVRARRRLDRNRWTFFRSQGCTAQDYFFIGLDPEAKTVEAMYRVSTLDMPGQGFSVAPEGNSKWKKLDLGLGLPKPVSDFVPLRDLEGTHLEIMSLSTKILTGMTDNEKYALIQRAFSYHRVLGFPYPSMPSDKQLASWIAQIRNYVPNGKELLRETAGLGFCSSYLPHRFDTKNADAEFSALGAFENDGALFQALQFSLRGKTPGLSRRNLRSSLTALYRTPTQFSPSVAKALVEKYCPPKGLVFDPCAGWGGRMLGTLIANRSYAGVEPVKETVDALYHMGMRLCEHLDMDRSSIRLIEGYIQDIPDASVKAGFALTSPPYWTKEIYTGDRDSQSVESWTETFLTPMFQKVSTMLIVGGYFAVNVSDIQEGAKQIPLEKLTLESAESVGFKLEDAWRMCCSSFGAQESDRFEPVMIFRKG